MPDDLSPDRFAVHRHRTPSGGDLAYLRENPGGTPLLLVHGWPETKRIWWRNVAPLAAAGFEVIVPDLRGFGDSSVATDGFYDAAANAIDLHHLLHDALGHERCFAAAGDFGGVVVQELGLRHPGFVTAQCLFNTILPPLREAYAHAGIAPGTPERSRMASDYFVRQGTDADGLAAELDTPERRRRYVGEAYGHRFWATPGAFTADEVDFMTEPFGDAERFRAGLGLYEAAMRTRPVAAPPAWGVRSDVPTVALYGPDDHVVWPDFPERCEVAFTDLTGPYVVPRAGHFLQWERAHLLNQTLRGFFGRFGSPVR
ncbi:MAG: alpha/beta hydrolase [Solirubrobacteraceae bacterium]|nr:alpha/beta hydrolase [Solirubrobacteraceae bacterium]